MPKQNPLFTVSQFSKLHKINRRTLMYYDDIGLFHPDVKKENGYRYYSMSQSPLLEMILTLRELDMSIDEIRRFLSSRSPETLVDLLSAKTGEIDKSIRRLKEIKSLLENQTNSLKAQATLDFSAIETVSEKEETLAVVAQVVSDDYEKSFQPLIEQARRHSTYRMFNQSYGTMFDVNCLRDGNPADIREYLFLKIDHPKSKKGLFIKPAGNYLRAWSKGSWDLLPALYDRLAAFADANGLRLCGYSFETGINEIAIDCMEDYITQVDIRVEPLTAPGEPPSSRSAP